MKGRLRQGLVVGALCLLAYANSVTNPFHYDDDHSIVHNPHIRTLTNVPAFFVDPTLFSVNPELAMYRPLLLASYTINYSVSALQVWSYHLLGILLHAGCAVLTLVVGHELLGNRRAALLAGFLKDDNKVI